MIIEEILRGKKLAFDVGSNIGAKAELYLSYGVKVVCVEPQENCLIELYKKFKDKNVEIVPYGLSSDGKHRKFRISSASTLSTFSETFVDRTGKERFKNYSWGDPIDIETKTLEEIVTMYGVPDFCKIDVEGSEKEVLLGLSTPLPYISFEYTPELHDIAVECLSILESLGDYSFKYSEGETLEYSQDKWMVKEDINKYLLLISDSIVFGDIYAKLKEKHE
jgi:FkbM family methyltransferase